MSVVVSWANKKQLDKCAYMVGFPIPNPLDPQKSDPSDTDCPGHPMAAHLSITHANADIATRIHVLTVAGCISEVSLYHSL